MREFECSYSTHMPAKMVFDTSGLSPVYKCPCCPMRFLEEHADKALAWLSFFKEVTPQASAAPSSIAPPAQYMCMAGGHFPTLMVENTTLGRVGCLTCAQSFSEGTLSVCDAATLGAFGLKRVPLTAAPATIPSPWSSALWSGSALPYEIPEQSEPAIFTIPPTKANQARCDYAVRQKAPADPIDCDTGSKPALEAATIKLRQQVAHRIRTWPVCHIQNRNVDLVVEHSITKAFAYFHCKHCK